MRLLQFSADYLSPSILDCLSNDQADLESLNLEPRLVSDILDWNRRYQPIVIAAERARSALTETISDLDLEGVALAARIARDLGSGTKVSYYSEGTWRTIS